MVYLCRMKTTYIQFRIEKELKAKIKEYATEKGKTVTQIVTDFLKSELKGN